MEKKELLIYKILLDILGSYIRNFKGINSKDYSNKYLFAALNFYKKVNKNELVKVIEIIINSILKAYENGKFSDDAINLFFKDVV